MQRSVEILCYLSLFRSRCKKTENNNNNNSRESVQVIVTKLDVFQCLYAWHCTQINTACICACDLCPCRCGNIIYTKCKRNYYTAKIVLLFTQFIQCVISRSLVIYLYEVRQTRTRIYLIKIVHTFKLWETAKLLFCVLIYRKPLLVCHIQCIHISMWCLFTSATVEIETTQEQQQHQSVGTERKKNNLMSKTKKRE